MITASSLTNGTLTLVLDGGSQILTARNDHPKWVEIVAAFKAGNETMLQSLISLKAVVENYSVGMLSVNNTGVTYNGNPIHTIDGERVMAFLRDGLPYKPIANYIARKMANPSQRAINEMYGFLEHKGMPLTFEGKIIAYKGVQDNYWSVTGNKDTVVLQGKVNDEFQILNEIGATIEVQRNSVCDDFRQHCAGGLHAGSLVYAKGFAYRIILVEIDPADVVSIPEDCNCQKMRCCKYKVVGEYTGPMPDTYTKEFDKQEDVKLDDEECCERCGCFEELCECYLDECDGTTECECDECRDQVNDEHSTKSKQPDIESWLYDAMGQSCGSTTPNPGCECSTCTAHYKKTSTQSVQTCPHCECEISYQCECSPERKDSPIPINGCSCDDCVKARNNPPPCDRNFCKDTYTKLRQILEDQSGKPASSMYYTTKIESLGLDSLDVVELALAIEDEFHFADEITDSECEKYANTTIAEVVNAINNVITPLHDYYQRGVNNGYGDMIVGNTAKYIAGMTLVRIVKNTPNSLEVTSSATICHNLRRLVSSVSISLSTRELSSKTGNSLNLFHNQCLTTDKIIV